ncbi:Glutathione S-transferase GstB [Kluyvera cryocrescens]|uniref:Glutathione S-transferase GstB n=1 Tax=Kluyvera cryocrescens TaxID=580 RepID=A0A485D459_KLUCR|nr:Glutathione S-transferase GstB [Kluyvera cryocrescens]
MKRSRLCTVKILFGLVRTPVEKRNMAEIEAAMVACEPLFEILDNTLATQTWLSGDHFGVGDIAVAPFVYNLLETVKNLAAETASGALVSAACRPPRLPRRGDDSGLLIPSGALAAAAHLQFPHQPNMRCGIIAIA